MLQNRKKLIVWFEGSQVYLSAKSIPLAATNIPTIVSSFQSSAHWKITVEQHLDDEKKLIVSILSYHHGSAEVPDEQRQLFPVLEEIREITFRSFNTEKLLASARNQAFKYNSSDFEDEPEPTPKIISETIHIPIKKLNFHLGRVSFTHRFKGFATATEISIENYELREEFDAIKNYFEKVFGKKKIQAVVALEMDGSYAKITKTSSPEIASINKDLIDSVRFEFVKGLKRKAAPPEIDKRLFTMDEYLDQFAGDEFKSNTFHNTATDLFEDLLQVSDSKHYKQLRYLSSIHAGHIMKLRFVHDPFSFIFLVEGEYNYHIIWETLDTEEATYIWHTDKTMPALKSELQKIEQILHVIKVQGKTAYINATEDHFRRIYHDYSEVVEGFIKWKGMLERYLS